MSSDPTVTGEFDYIGHDLEAMSVAKNYYDWLLGLIAPYICGRVAEIGAGRGTLSRRLLALRLDTLHAFEPSPQMFAKLNDALANEDKAVAVNDTIADWGETQTVRFDSVIYFNVLEHIEQDAAELRRAYLAMAESAHLIVYSPALPWLYSEFDRSVGHVRRYTINEATAKLVAAGFELVSARYVDVLGVLPWYLSMVLRSGTLSPAKARIYDRFVVPIGRRLEALIKPPLGKNVLIVGKKPRGAHTA